MPETIDVSPFVVTVGDDDVVFRFDRASFEQGFEYPPNLEGMIASLVDSRPGLLDKRRTCVDLENLPAISSKQLGAMLAVRKACGANRKIPLLNIRPNVRELLHITKLSDFFEWD